MMEAYDADGEGFNRALAGERVFSMAALASPQKLLGLISDPKMADIPEGEREQMVARLREAKSLKEEEQVYEKIFQQVMSARREAFPGRLKVDDVIKQRMTEAAEKKFFLTCYLMKGLGGHAVKEAKCLASLRLALTGLALEQFRLSHDQYPNVLSELTPVCLAAVPVDPFDGHPLRYRNKADGYLLYSIGPDLKDDSGRPLDEKGGDLVFGVSTPPKPLEKNATTYGTHAAR